MTSDIKELRIYDKSDDILMPFSKLLNSVNQFDPDLLKGEWIISKGAYGYGEMVCKIEDDLTTRETVKFQGDNLFSVLTLGDQYFYNAQLCRTDGKLGLGIFDSTYLFVRGEDSLLKKLKSEHRDTKLV